MRTKAEPNLTTLMHAHGVCPKCARPILLSTPESKVKAWGVVGGCCQACRDGIKAALAMWGKRGPN